MNRSLAHALLVTGASVWCALLVLAPLLASAGYSDASNFLYRLFSGVCHQFDDRSIHLFGYKLAVCSRCSAIYFGFLLGAIAWQKLRFRSRPILWAFAAAPMFIDVALDVIGVHPSTLSSRITTGSAFGVIAALILVPLIHEGLAEFFTIMRGFVHERQTR